MSKIVLGNTVTGKLSLKKNSGNIVANTAITSLQVVNTNAFQFKVITTGAIRVYWGDNTYTDIATQSNLYTINKTYSTSGTYNIIITNPDKVIRLQFDHTTYAPKINTNVNWFSQFYNLQYIYLFNASFIGDLAPVIENINTMNSLYINYSSAYSFYFNISSCKTFWTRCLFLYFYKSLNVSGSFTDINLNNNITYIYIFIFNYSVIGDCSGIIKNSYTSLTYIQLYTLSNTLNNLSNLDDFIIPQTLLEIINIRGQSTTHGSLTTFDFKNLIIYTTEGSYSNVDLTNNISFNNFIQNNCTNFQLRFTGNTPLKINLDTFIKNTYSYITISGSKNYNSSYGNVANLISKTTNSIWISGGKQDGAMYGEITTIVPQILMLEYIDVTISIDTLKYLYNLTTKFIYIVGLQQITGNLDDTIVNNYLSSYSSSYGFVLKEMNNLLVTDITTWVFNSTLYTNTYCVVNISYNPGFYGNLGNLTLWQNKSQIILNDCVYTGIPGFVRKVFTNRNTCLKATGGTTTINVANNVDNSSITGTLQRGSLGTYTGNQNDLTETQIDNLANGLDYTGSGNNTTWTDKEKIWWLLNCKNSSSDNSSRYRLSSFSI